VTRISAMVVVALGLVGTAHAQAPQPFTATYTVEWKGMSAGVSTLELLRTSSGAYEYRSRNLARGIFRIAFPDAITQTSTFTIDGNGNVVPQTYLSDDGSKKTDRDVSLTFDWANNRARGTAEDKPVDVALKPGTQDALSVQIQLMIELAAGKSPTRFWLIDKNEPKEYQYTRERTETIDTPFGKLDTVVYKSQRTGSDRFMRFWLAPSKGYLPVKAERRRGDRLDFALKIKDFKSSAT
jgi:Protein of unknown function (DUF3108)